MDIGALLDQARKSAGLRYDKDLAALLNVEPSSVSNWRKGRSLPDVVTCEKLALLCGFPPIKVIAEVNEERAISAAEKKVWRKLATALVMGIVLYVPTVSAANLPTNGSDLYIMRNPLCPSTMAMAGYCDVARQ